MEKSEASVAPDGLGVIAFASPYGFSDTLEHLENTLRAKNIHVFAKIDHAAAAAEVGLSMPPTVVLIFGNPRGGTPLMLENPLLALDLPLKVLVREDGSAQTWVNFNTPDYLSHRYAIPAEKATALSAVPGLVAAALVGKGM